MLAELLDYLRSVVKLPLQPMILALLAGDARGPCGRSEVLLERLLSLILGQLLPAAGAIRAEVKGVQRASWGGKGGGAGPEWANKN